MRHAAHASWRAPKLRCHRGKIVRARRFAHVPGLPDEADGEGNGEGDDETEDDGSRAGCGLTFGVASAPRTDDHNWAYHGSSGADLAAAAAGGLGVAVNVTYGTWPGCT